MADKLDILTNEIEQGFKQRGGWKACRHLLERETHKWEQRAYDLEDVLLYLSDFSNQPMFTDDLGRNAHWVGEIARRGLDGTLPTDWQKSDGI